MVRRATGADAQATRAFRQKLLAEGLQTIFSDEPPTLEEQRQWHAQIDADDHSAIFVHEDNGEVVGLLSFHSFASTAECRHAGRFGVAVLDSHRGQGIGGQLLQALLDWAAAHPEVQRLELEVFSNNPAIHLYERFGFEVEGVKKRAVRLSEGYVDSIVMTLWVSDNAESAG